MAKKKFVGTAGIPAPIPYIGVGFVTIPPGVDKNDFINDCYVTNTVSITGFDFGHLHNVSVDVETMQHLVFPNDIGEMGSAVAFITVPKHNVPIIVGCLKNEKDVYTLNQNRNRKTKTFDERVVDLDMDASDGRISLSVSSDSYVPAILELLVKGINEDNHLKVEVEGQTFIKSSDDILMISNTMQEKVVLDNKGVVVGKLKISAVDDERFLYEDNFSNKILASSEGLRIEDKNGNIITINESGVNINAADNGIKLSSNDSVIEINDDGVNIDSGSKQVSINGDFEALYNKIPGAPIADVSQIGISKNVKIG